VSTDAWKDSLNSSSLTARIGAGKTFYDLMTLIRPQGFLMKTRPAGRFFSIGGVVANMVHGGGRGAGFIYEDVTALHVMTANGSLSDITSASDLNSWFSSAGLLGVILAVEFKLIPDNGITMIPESTYFAPPSSISDLSAFTLYVNSITNKIYSIASTSTHAEFFFEPYNSTLYSLYTINSGNSYPNANATDTATKNITYTSAYAALNAAFKNTSGSYLVDVTDPCQILPANICTNKQASAVVASIFSSASAAQSFLDSANSVNDGYWLTTASKFHSNVFFAPALALTQLFSVYLQVFASFATNPDTPYYPNQPLEIRFLNPSGSGVLNPIPAFSSVAADFLSKYSIPIYAFSQSGVTVPDGYVAIEQLDINWGTSFSSNYSSYLGALQVMTYLIDFELLF